MLDVIQTIFWGLVLLTVIVFIHEAGHFLAARAFGLRVKEFMIGLPGPKVFFTRKETRYGVTAIPLGGYCLIAGMEQGNEDNIEKALSFIAYFGRIYEDGAVHAGKQLGFDLVEGLDTLADWGTVRRFKEKGLYHYSITAATIDGVKYSEGQPRNIVDKPAFLAAERKLGYGSLPWWKRVVILCAGSFSNLLIALTVLIVILMINGSQVRTTTIESVAESSPAAEAGIAAGDTLVSFDGETIESWQGFLTALQTKEPGDVIEVGYLHEGREQVSELTLGDREGSPFMGVVSHTERESISFLQAAEESVSLIGTVFTALAQLVNPATFSQTSGELSSVVGISIEARAAAASGPQVFILLIAALSVSIGIMNLLPIPPLDGGKIVIETIERIFRRKIPVAVINGISLAGFAAMILLFVVATNADINRYFLGG